MRENREEEQEGCGRSERCRIVLTSCVEAKHEEGRNIGRGMHGDETMSTTFWRSVTLQYGTRRSQISPCLPVTSTEQHEKWRKISLIGTAPILRPTEN